MLCFGLSNEGEGLSVPLCEEAIGYHTLRSAGIPLRLTLVVKSHNDEPKYLRLWHRAQVDDLSLDETGMLLNAEDFNTWLFFNLVENRGRVHGPSEIEIVLFDSDRRNNPSLLHERPVVASVPTVGHGEGFTLLDPVGSELQSRGLPTPEPRYVPYTCARIGPFTGKNRYYAFRITACIEDVAYGRLVDENPVLGTRYYEVYGTDDIRSKITELDLPRLRRACSPEVCEVYTRHYVAGFGERLLSPDFYSVIAMDSPDSAKYAPHGVYTIQCKKALKELTNQINPAIFDQEGLHDLRDRVFWFVNRDSRQDFYLWLEGPMAEVHNDCQLLGSG